MCMLNTTSNEMRNVAVEIQLNVFEPTSIRPATHSATVPLALLQNSTNYWILPGSSFDDGSWSPASH